MRWLMIAFGLVAFIVLAGIGWTEWQMAGIETPDYTVEHADGPIEIRAYAPMLVASVTVPGPRETATSRGFSPLAAFIFGENTPADTIAMTAPVLAEPQAGEAIAMTAPVLSAEEEAGAWTVSFVMPRAYDRATLPAPNNPEITIAERPGERVVAYRFSGIASEKALAEAAAALEAFMIDKGLSAVGPARNAFYDPPWRLPFRRRNEVIIPLA